MPKLQTYDGASDRHIILLMGPSKAGKTTLACLLFGKQNTFVLSFDPDGLKSVRPIDAFIVDPKKPWDYCVDVFPEITKLKGKKNTCVVDDLTHMGYVFLRVQKSYKDSRKTYGEAIEQMRQLVEKLKYDFPWLNIIYTSTDMYVEDQEEKVVMTYPNVIGRYTFAQEMPGRCDHVFYLLPPKQRKKVVDGGKRLIIDKVERKILTTSDGVLMAGNRVNQAGGETILELQEEVSVDDGLKNIERLRSKLLGTYRPNSSNTNGN